MTVTEQLSALDQILAHGDLHCLFQPILSLSERRLVGYEALTRGPSNGPLHSPLPLFSIARSSGRLSQLELLCRRKACARFRDLKLEGKLFLNVSPESLLEPTHQPGRTLQLLQTFGISPSDVVIELTEQTPIEDFTLLDTALHHYRAMGFSIALDDLGAGYSSLRLWSELRPDYVKIDRHFIEGIHLDAVKREFVGSILKMAHASRAQVIAEGIEIPEELAVLSEMGVDLVQGYLLGRPNETPPRDARALLPEVDSAGALLAEDQADLEPLLLEQPAVRDSTPIADVLEAFRAQANLNSLAVLDGHDQPVGIVHRHALSDTLLKPFAPELYARKPISRLMSDDFLAVERSQSLQQVSRLLTSRARQRIEEDFIITLNGRYLGLGRVIDVLKLITELKIRQARHANPLTLLPGNVPIQQCLSRLLQQGREAWCAMSTSTASSPSTTSTAMPAAMKFCCAWRSAWASAWTRRGTSSAISAATISCWCWGRRTGASGSTTCWRISRASAGASTAASTWTRAASSHTTARGGARSIRCYPCRSAWCT